jgi:hypothetical protein
LLACRRGQAAGLHSGEEVLKRLEFVHLERSVT